MIGASMWFCPHIVVLDEPTSFTSSTPWRSDSAIKEFQGGVLMSRTTPSSSVILPPRSGRCPWATRRHVSGAEWMEAWVRTPPPRPRPRRRFPQQDEEKFDALGNKIETAVIRCCRHLTRDHVKKLTKQLKALKERVKKGDAFC